jgi:hypothetical protein
MISSVADFETGTVFERFVLGETQPLVPSASGQENLDLRTGRTFNVVVGISTGESVRTKIIALLRPMLFAAAWKILDQALELALYGAGLRPPRSRTEWKIEEKAAQARAYSGSLPPLTAETDVWQRLCRVYTETVEARHCLIHRAYVVDGHGNLTQLKDRKGNPRPDITALEQEATTRLSQRVAVVIIGGGLGSRDRLDLEWSVDKLADHHGLPLLGGIKSGPVPRIIANAKQTPEGWVVDPRALLESACQSLPAVAYFDLELHFPDSGLPPLVGELESMPQAQVTIDPEAAPSWLRPV